MVFYVFAKERWVGEAEQVANLLDAVVGLLQVVADVLKHVLDDPFVGGLSRMLLAECREKKRTTLRGQPQTNGQ